MHRKYLDSFLLVACLKLLNLPFHYSFRIDISDPESPCLPIPLDSNDTEKVELGIYSRLVVRDER